MHAGEEECLYTNEAILQGGGVVFEATACHSVVLSAAEQLSAPLLFGTRGLPQDLRFEVRTVCTCFFTSLLAWSASVLSFPPLYQGQSLTIWPMM